MEDKAADSFNPAKNQLVSCHNQYCALSKEGLKFYMETITNEFNSN